METCPTPTVWCLDISGVNATPSGYSSLPFDTKYPSKTFPCVAFASTVENYARPEMARSLPVRRPMGASYRTMCHFWESAAAVVLLSTLPRGEAGPGPWSEEPRWKPKNRHRLCLGIRRGASCSFRLVHRTVTRAKAVSWCCRVCPTRFRHPGPKTTAFRFAGRCSG